MAESGVTATLGAGRTRGQWLSTVARQRELSLVAIMFVLGGLVSVTAPQFLTLSNLSQVAVLASIVAVAAVGEALVMITRNIDLSVEAMIGLVAYCVAIVLQRHTLDAPVAIALGIGIGLVLGMINGAVVTLLKVPSIVATLGTLSIFRGVDYLIAGSHQVPLAGLPPGFTDPARDSVLGIPIFVLVTLLVVVIGSVILRSTRFGRQVYAVGSNPEAAAILGIPSRLVSGATRRLRPSSGSRPAWSCSPPSHCAACSPASPAYSGSWSSGRSTGHPRQASCYRSWPRSSSGV